MESASEITVQGASVTRLTSDAFLALPEDALGTEYYVMSYLSKDPQGKAFRKDHGPTQFAIIAVKDNTVVHIALPKDVYDNGRSNVSLHMSTHDAFQVQR